MTCLSEDKHPAKKFADPVRGEGADADTRQNSLESLEKTDFFNFPDQVLPFHRLQAPVERHHQEDDREQELNFGFGHIIFYSLNKLG